MSLSNDSFPLSTLFDDSEKIKRTLNKKYFPKENEERKNKICDLALVRLAYLARIGSESKKSPFTKKGHGIVCTSNRHNSMTVCGLWIGVITATIGTAALAYLGLTYDDESSPEEVAGFLTIGAVGNMAGVALSYWATGFSPHISSNSNNKQQDMLLETDRVYDDLGYRLIELYFTPEKSALAEEIAQRIDCDKIVKKIARAIGSPSRAAMMVTRLKEAVAYINSCEEDEVDLPECTRFRHFIFQMRERGSV